MAISDGELSQFALREETSWGVVASGLWTLINAKTFDIKRNRTVQRPDVIRGDRRRYQSRVLAASSGPTATCPAQYGNTTMLWEGFQGSHKSSATIVTGTTLAITAHTITDSANGLGSFHIGDWVYISGSVPAADNRWVGPLSAVSAGSITFPQTLTPQAAGVSVTVDTIRLLDDKTRLSYSLEEAFTDLNSFRVAQGCRVSQIQKSWNVNAYVEEVWSFMGDAPKTLVASLGTGYTAAPNPANQDFLTTLDTDFTMLEVGGAASSLIISQYQLTGTNNNNIIQGIGRGSGPAEVGVHAQDIDLSFTAFLDAAGLALVQMADAHQPISFAWSERDSQHNSVLYAIPDLTPDEGEPEPVSTNKENTAKFKLTQFYDPNSGPYQFGIFLHTAP